MLLNLLAKRRHNEAHVEPCRGREGYGSPFSGIAGENTRDALRPLPVEDFVLQIRLVFPLTEIEVLSPPQTSISLKTPCRCLWQKRNAAKERALPQDAVVSQIFC